MIKWCKLCQSTHGEREGGIVYGKNGESLYWICAGLWVGEQNKKAWKKDNAR